CFLRHPPMQMRQHRPQDRTLAPPHQTNRRTQSPSRETAPGPPVKARPNTSLVRYAGIRFLRRMTRLWKRPGLSARDRSLITVAVLIARNETIEMPYYFNLALDNGVKASEISEVITHLAFYSGWASFLFGVG